VSSEALAWAFKQSVKPSGAKFTLIALCECANYKTGRITPSIAHLVEITGQNRKSIIAHIDQLEAQGFIRFTGERTGRTGQIKVYEAAIEAGAQAHRPEAHYVYRLTNPQTGEFYIGVRSFLGEPCKDGYRGSGCWPSGAAYHGIELHREIVAEFTTRNEAERAEASMIAEAISLPLCRNIKQESQKRDTYPKTVLLKSTNFGRKQSQKRDTEPSLEPSHSTEPKGSSECRRARTKPDEFPCPEGVDLIDWRALKANRKAKRAALTEGAHRQIVRKLDGWQRDGWPPGPIVAFAAERGWTTVFETDEMKGSGDAKRSPNGKHSGGSGKGGDSRDGIARALDRRLGLDEPAGTFGRGDLPEGGRYRALPSA